MTVHELPHQHEAAFHRSDAHLEHVFSRYCVSPQPGQIAGAPG